LAYIGGIILKVQKGVSMIALIITIIVIIILAAIVISAGVNTPEQANWARFCQDFSEIQLSVRTAYTSRMSDYSLGFGKEGIVHKPSKQAIYYEIARGVLPDYTNPTELLTYKGTGDTYIDFDASPFLGITKPMYAGVKDVWKISLNTGEIGYFPGMVNPTDSKIYYTPYSNSIPTWVTTTAVPSASE
jgi:hypothetical protein